MLSGLTEGDSVWNLRPKPAFLIASWSHSGEATSCNGLADSVYYPANLQSRVHSTITFIRITVLSLIYEDLFNWPIRLVT